MTIGTVIGINQTLELRAYCHMDNQLAVNVYFFRVSAIAVAPGAGDAATAFNSLITALMRPLISNTALYLGTSARLLDGGVWPTFWHKDATRTGTGGADPIPKQCAGLFRKKTANGGRKGNGRTFIPFPTESQCEPNGNPTAAYLTLLENLATALNGVVNLTANGTTTTGNFGLSSSAPGVPAFRPYTGYQIVDRFATQRRRGDYGRVNSIPAPLA